MRYTNKKILKITFPVLVCLLMEQLIGLTDTAYLGRVGEAELGASALAGIFYLMIFMLGFGFSIGAQILIARRNGAKEYSQIGPLFMQSTAFLLLMALVLFILSKVFAARIMGALIEAPDVREAAVPRLPGLRFLLRLRRVDVPGILCRHDPHAHPDDQLDRHGTHQCRIELPADLRKIRIPRNGHRRRCDRLFYFGRRIRPLLHTLHPLSDRLAPL